MADNSSPGRRFYYPVKEPEGVPAPSKSSFSAGFLEVSFTNVDEFQFQHEHDIEFPNYYVNIHLLSWEKPALTALCHLLAMSNSIS